MLLKKYGKYLFVPELSSYFESRTYTLHCCIVDSKEFCRGCDAQHSMRQKFVVISQNVFINVKLIRSVTDCNNMNK